MSGKMIADGKPNVYRGNELNLIILSGITLISPRFNMALKVDLTALGKHVTLWRGINVIRH